jgi:hypothetical protein
MCGYLIASVYTQKMQIMINLSDASILKFDFYMSLWFSKKILGYNFEVTQHAKEYGPSYWLHNCFKIQIIDIIQTIKIFNKNQINRIFHFWTEHSTQLY